MLAHFPPEDDYNAPVRPQSLKKAEKNYKDRAITSEAISLFGLGNGGGGPSERHLEGAKRCKDLNGVPRYNLGKAQPVLDHFVAINQTSKTGMANCISNYTVAP